MSDKPKTMADATGCNIPQEWEAMTLAGLFQADAHLYDEDEDA